MNERLIKDYVVTIDKSGSMTTKLPSGETRWQQGQEYVTAIASYCQDLDPDGIKVVTFNGNYTVEDNVTSDKVSEIFKTQSPFGGTNLAAALQVSFDDYLARKESGESKEKGETNIVLTDGEPNGGDAGRQLVMKTIVDFTLKLDKEDEYSISFIQVGDDKLAADFLRALDDDLQSMGAKFDIVDTKSCEDIDTLGLTIESLLIAALED